jgi:hypothetical protein
MAKISSTLPFYRFNVANLFAATSIWLSLKK